MAETRLLELDGMRLRLDAEKMTIDDLEDLQECIAIFRRRFDRKRRLYDPKFVEALTGCLDAPLP